MCKPFSQNSWTSAALSCPYKINQTIPCDIDTLDVSIQNADGSKVKMDSPWQNPLHKQAVTSISSSDNELIQALRKYDIVLETVASRQTVEVLGDAKSPDKPATVNIRTAYHGTCPIDKHPNLRINGFLIYPQYSLEKTFYAPSFSSNIKPAVWIQKFWPFGKSQINELVIEADSCGVRASGNPNKTLNCLVRIYPNDQYQLTLKIPAFYGLKRTRKAEIEYKKGDSPDSSRAFVTTNSESSSTSKWGQETSSESFSHASSTGQNLDITTYTYTEREGNVSYQLSESSGIKNGDVFISESETETHYKNRVLSNSSSYTRSDSSDEGLESSEEKHKQLTTGILLTRNGAELDISKTINTILSLKKTLEEAWNAIKGMVPKVGWSIDFSLSILEGSIAGKWGVKTGGNQGDRWRLIEPEVSLDVDVKIVSIIFTMAAGIEFMIDSPTSWFGLGSGKLVWIVAKIEATFEATAAIKETINYSKKEQSIEPTGEYKWEVAAHGRVELVGYAYDAKAGLKGGMKFAGAMKTSAATAPIIEGEFYFEQTTVYLTASKPGRGRVENKKSWEKIIYEKCSVWKGKLPEETT